MEENDLLASIESGEWVSLSKGEAKSYAALARNQLKKDHRISLRISGKDLKRLQKRAFEEGIPYQTFIGSILHKYLIGRLTEVKN